MKRIFSPYRICPIGAHIDHQGGTVLGRTLAFGTSLEYEPLTSNKVYLTSDQLGRADFRIGELDRGHWARYAQAAARVLKAERGMIVPPRWFADRFGIKFISIGGACLSQGLCGCKSYRLDRE